MTAPVTIGPDTLSSLLALVDGSTTQALAAEDQLVAESDNLYAQRMAEFTASPDQASEDSDTHPFVNAALLAAMVLLLRRAFGSGSAEGLRFGGAQLSVAGIPFDPASVTVSTGFIDSVVKDFLAGQVDVASKGTNLLPQVLASTLAQRARTGVLVAYHGGRSEMTEAALASAVSEWTGAVHKMWVARFDLETPPCPLCIRLHGSHVPVGADFPTPDDEPAPYLGKLERPPRHPRCRCSLVLYLPTKMSATVGPTPLSMVLYANSILELAGHSGNEFVAATVVYIKPYTRVVDGKTQMVDGYYYDVQSGLKVPEGSFAKSAVKPQKLSAQAAKKLTESANASGKQSSSGAEAHKWPPGTYAVNTPPDPESPGVVHVVVHPDGTSTSVWGDNQEEADAKKTDQYLFYWSAQGALVHPGGHELDTPPDKATATLPPGHHLLLDHKTFGGVEVHSDGSGKLHNKDFTKTIPLKQKSVQDIAKGYLGKTQPATPEDFVPEWQKTHDAAKAADAVPDEVAVADHPKTGQGGTLTGQTLFDVGSHKVAFDEGAQVFRSASSKDTVYVLDHEGTVTKYNPQGSGVQATVVASSENPSARSALLAKLDNVSEHGTPVKNGHAVPGTKQVYLGGYDLTSTQLEDAIGALNASPSPAISSVLAKQGSPLASADVHAIAAPYKALFNNKTKPAFLHALGLAYQKSGHTPLASTGAVSHLEQHHDMADHHADLGSSDAASIHDALHSLEGNVGDHTHTDAGPGTIDIYGTPFPPEMVSAAIQALKDEKSTSVKGPLKKAGSPLAGAALSEFANGYAGTKLHYSKFKPTLIKALQDSLDQHQKVAPPHPPPAVTVPPPEVEFHGVFGTHAQLAEARDFLDGIDISAMTGDVEGSIIKKVKSGPADNPFLQQLDWVDVADAHSGGSTFADMNLHIHDALTKAMGSKELPVAPKPAPVPKALLDKTTIQGKSFNKSDLLKAVDLLKSEQSTSVKGPLKGELPALAKVDLKAFAEEHAGTKLHYSKLKPAVIEALQAKANELVDPLPAGAPDPASVVTKLVEPAPAPEPSAVEKDIAKATPNPDNVGTWTLSSTGSTLIVHPDGSATLVGIHGSEIQYIPETVDYLLGGGGWNKVADHSVDPSPPPPEIIPPSDGYKLSASTGYGVDFADKPQLYDISQKWASDAGFGDVAGQHLKNKSKPQLKEWVQAWATGNWDKAYEIEAAGLKKHKFSTTHPGSPDNPDNKNGFVKKVMAPAVAGEIPGGDSVPGNWPDTFPYNWSEDQIDAYLTAAHMQNPTGLSSYQKKKWVHAHTSGDKPGVDRLSLAAEHNVSTGNVMSDPILPPVEKYLPGQAVPADPSWPSFDPAKASAVQMTNLQVDHYLAHLGTPSAVKVLHSQPLEVKQQLVQLHYVAGLPASASSFKKPADAKKQMNELLNKIEADTQFQNTQDVTSALAEALTVKEHFYTKDPVQPFFGGGSGASMVQVTDETGKQFIFKAAGSPYRADTEHGMHVLARMSGIQAADSRLGMLDGEFGQFQVKLDSKSSLTGVPASALTSSALSDVVRSHVFDWAINNDDAHSENFLLSPDSSRAFPIDFGRGYARFGTGWMQLELGQLSGQADLYYNKVYSDILKGSIDDKNTDKLYLSALSQAQRMQGISDGAWSSVLKDAFSRRTNFKSTSASSAEELIAQALDRKNSLVEDFDKFWDSIYAKLGRAKPDRKASIADHVFTGNTVDWHTRAQSIGAGGAASFFAGTDLEDGHLLGQVVLRSDKAGPATKKTPTVHGVKVGDYYDAENELTITVNPDGSIDGLPSEDIHPIEVFDAISDLNSAWEWQPPATEDNLTGGANQEFWLSGQLRGGADTKLRAWLTSHYTGNVSADSGPPPDSSAQVLAGLGIADVPDVMSAWAKTISHHHKKGDKDYNTLAKDNYLKARAKLVQLRASAKALVFPPSVPAADHAQYSQMLDYYLNQADSIDNLIIKGGVSHKGDFPPFDFKLTPAQAIDPQVKSPAKIKVEMRHAFMESGQGDENGNLVTSGSSGEHGSGKVFVATLPNGTEIEYRSWHPNEAVPLAQQGALKVKVRSYDGSPASVEPAMAALRDMGLDLGDSSDEDMELFYWRHLYGVLSSRNDRNSGAYGKVLKSVKKDIDPEPDGSSSLPKEDELAAWRAAWSHVDATAVQEFVTRRGYLPQFSHPNVTKPHEVGGQPHWVRFDVNLDELRAGNNMPVRSVSKVGAMIKVIKSGGSYSTEDRPKVLGQWSSGMSSSTDQQEGSSNFVFTRLNLSGPGYQYYFRPEVMARTSNYSYATDRYGRLKDRPSNAYFDFAKATGHGGTGNEMMIKHALTLLDDMELVGFSSESERQDAIAFLKSHGIFEIRGLPLENRLVNISDIKAAIKKVVAHRKAWKPPVEGVSYGTTE